MEGLVTLADTEDTMMNLIPWKRKNGSHGGDGGVLSTMQDFPTVLRRMRNEFDDLFDEFTRSWPALERTFGTEWKWGLDVTDEEDHVAIRAEAPGFEPGDFDIRAIGDRLVIRAAHKKESKRKGEECLEQCECFESMTLPPGVDPTRIDATYKSGVLFLTIPKTKEGRGMRINVKAG